MAVVDVRARTSAQAVNPVKIVTFEDMVVVLADEGVPVRAIARAGRVPGEELYELLKTAVNDGKLIELPKDDWPPGSQRSKRIFGTTPLLNLDDTTLRLACTQVFNTSRLQSAVLVALLRRPEMTKEQIHNAIESTRSAGREPTGVKMIDVVIYHIRKHLKDAGVELKTIWGIGYALPTDQRDKALGLLSAHLAGGPNAAAA